MKHFLIIILLMSGIFLGANAQEFHMPKPSPTVSVDQGFSTSFIKLKYSRPSVKDRVIFGQLIPYGKIWRTGANEATKITFGEDVSLSGHPIKAGTYELYTIPGKQEWKIILNSKSDNWGAAGYDKKENTLSFSVPVKHLNTPQESFLISIEDLINNSCNIVLSWADVSVSFPVKADNNERILSHLDQALKGEKPPYAQAAGYYLSTNQKLDNALKYASLAIKGNPKAYYLYWLQARIYQKLGKHQEAVDAAKKAAELAKDHPAFAYEYEHHYQDMLKQK